MLDKGGAKTKFRSLSVTLTVAFLSLTLPILLIASGLKLYFTFQSQKQTVANYQQLTARSAANEVSSLVQGKVLSLKQAASINSLTSVDSQRQELVMNKLLGLNPEFRGLSILNLKGQELKKVSRSSITASTLLTDQAKGELFAKITKGETYISPVFINQATGEPLVIMAVPANDIFNSPVGVLAAEVNLKFMWDLVGQIKIGNGGQAYVVDRQGTLIAYADISRVLAGEKLTGLNEVDEFIKNKDAPEENPGSVAKGIKGTYVASTYIGLGVPDWVVIVETPVSEAYALVIQTLILSVLIVLASTAVTIVASIYLARRITGPILSLRDTAKRIGEGSLDMRMDIASNNEIGELASAFNLMTDKVQDAQENLQAQVDARTQQLSQKVEETERLNQTMVGRELKMIELKKQIDELTKKP